MKLTSYFLIIGTIFFGCNGNSGYETSNDYRSESVQAFSYNQVNDIEESEIESVDSEAKIIKESHLRFETSSVEKTYQSVNKWIHQHKGFIQSDATANGYGNIEREMVIRIPTTSFQTVIDSISNDVKVFDRKEISRRDVTEEFVDLEARLKAKRKLEARYLELLPKAKNVKEILEIEKEIAKIREEIEAKQGRLKYLESKVSLSTIYISFYEETSIEKPKSQTYFNRVIKALKGGFTGIGEFFIGILYLWPFLLIGFLLFVFIKRKIKKKKTVSK